MYEILQSLAATGHNGVSAGKGRRSHRRTLSGMNQTLYEKYGGFAAISRIVLDLYDRLLDDDDVGPFFENVELGRLVDHQTKFVSALLGGPVSFTEEQIRRMHGPLAIGDMNFPRLKILFPKTLADHGTAPADVEMVVGEFKRRRTLVVR